MAPAQPGRGLHRPHRVPPPALCSPKDSHPLPPGGLHDSLLWVPPCYSALLTTSDHPDTFDGSRQSHGAELDTSVGLGENGDFIHVSVYCHFVLFCFSV